MTRKLTVLALAALMASGGIVKAQDIKKEEPKSHSAHPKKKPDTQPDSKTKLVPIEIRQSGTDKRPAQDYYYDGTRLGTFEQLKIVIGPLNDPEASRLLKSSANKESTGMVFIVGGGLLCAGGFIYTIVAPESTSTSALPFGGGNTTTKPADPTPYYLLGGAGAFFAFIGFIVEGDAGQCRHDAVMRYNNLVKSDPGLSMIFLPHTNLPGLELTQRF